MMRDLDCARQLLLDEEHTCVLCRGDEVYTSRKSGISPMLDWLSEGRRFSGFSAADRIVGKAAALLFDLAGIRVLHAQVLSESALEYLRSREIKVSYDTLTPAIINRRGDGRCPMENAVSDVNDPQEALSVLLETRERLRKGESL